MDAQDLIDLHVIVNNTATIEAVARLEAYGDQEPMIYQARALTDPHLDYETPAFDAGWRLVMHHGAGWRCIRNGAATDDDVTTYHSTPAQAWQEACEVEELEPDTREAQAFYIVSEWLAERLTARGHIAKAFGSQWIWGRVTTGAALHSDAVIQEIAERA